MSEIEIRTLNKKMDRILFILDNDEGTGSKGLVSQVSDMKKDVDAKFIQIRNEFIGFVAQYNIDQAIKKGRNAVWNIVYGAVGTICIFLGKFLIALFFKI